MAESFVSILLVNRDKSGFFDEAASLLHNVRTLRSPIARATSLLENFKATLYDTKLALDSPTISQNMGLVMLVKFLFPPLLGYAISPTIFGKLEISDDKSSAISLRRLHMYIKDQVIDSSNFVQIPRQWCC